MLGGLVYASFALLFALGLALLLAAFGRRQYLEQVTSFLRRIHLLKPKTYEEALEHVTWRIEWHYRMYAMSIPQAISLLVGRALFGRRAMSRFLEEKVAFLKTGIPGRLAEYAKQDDIGMVINATSILDEYIGLIIASRFGVMITKTSWKRVFEGDGPLGRFSAKISMADVLGILVGDMQHDLPILKKIRNDFAHSMVPQSLTSDPHRSRCHSLKMKFPLAPDLLAECKTPERQRFMESTVSLLIFMSTVLHRNLSERTFILKHQAEINKEMRESLPWAIKPEPKAEAST
jgi:hypothetical protein